MGLWKNLWRLKRSDKGAATIEFAILAVPFFMLFIGILEVSLCFFFENTLVRGMELAVRDVRIGTNFDINAFKTKVCAEAAVIPDCTGTVYVRLMETTSVSPVDSQKVCRDGQSGITGVITQPETIVTAVGCLKWKLFTPLMSQFLQTSNDGTRAIAVAFAFRTEPFN
jgi:Flp pilus assembly protein TadG